MQKFAHQQPTTASREAVWGIWRDVNHWHHWDTELVSAQLDGAFKLGAKGKLSPKGSAPSTFTITELTEGSSFTFTVPIPLGHLAVAHYFVNAPGGGTVFVHDVAFTGALGWVFGQMLGKGYAKALPGVLQRIKALAEK
ncbi:MAG: SRPBCC family protein [Armatimonadetes bacterium]|nr:SRPBCC family protein [Anaerolineae bacterium]